MLQKVGVAQFLEQGVFRLVDLAVGVGPVLGVPVGRLPYLELFQVRELFLEQAAGQALEVALLVFLAVGVRLVPFPGLEVGLEVNLCLAVEARLEQCQEARIQPRAQQELERRVGLCLRVEQSLVL